jgi:hypothetical protein
VIAVTAVVDEAAAMDALGEAIEMDAESCEAVFSTTWAPRD